MFPELEKPLRDAFEEAECGTKKVITKYRTANQNLRTMFNRIVLNAGVTPWPKPFQNLRATRETELVETFPMHCVTAWIGHSEAVAKRHYLQVTDVHFARAIAAPATREVDQASTSSIGKVAKKSGTQKRKVEQ